MAVPKSSKWKERKNEEATFNDSNDELRISIFERLEEDKKVYKVRLCKLCSDGGEEVTEEIKVANMRDASVKIAERKEKFLESKKEIVFKIEWGRGEKYFGKVDKIWYSIPPQLVSLRKDLKDRECRDTYYEKTDHESQLWKWRIGNNFIPFVERKSELIRIKKEDKRIQENDMPPIKNTILSQGELHKVVPTLKSEIASLRRESRQKRKSNQEDHKGDAHKSGLRRSSRLNKDSEATN